MKDDTLQYFVSDCGCWSIYFPMLLLIATPYDNENCSMFMWQRDINVILFLLIIYHQCMISIKDVIFSLHHMTSNMLYLLFLLLHVHDNVM